MSGSSQDQRPPTLEQTRALEVIGSSVALSAGAGCGKTFVLAERFVRALEGADARPLGRVVALTFTNKAARELRDRIRQLCRARLANSHDPARWRSILRGLEAARIGTFHSFCGDVLRRHAIEAGVDPGFVVLDETIALSIREESLALAIRDRLTARDPDLIEMAVEYGLGMVRQSLEDLLGNRSVVDIQTWADRDPRELIDCWVRIWNLEVQPAMLETFREQTKPTLELIEATTFANEKIRAKLDEFREAMTGLDSPGDSIPTLLRIAEIARVQGLPAKTWPSPEVFGAFKDQFAAIRERARTLVDALRRDEPTTLIAARQGLMLARLAVRARIAYDRAKKARGGIDNDDLLLLTRDLLDHPDRPVRDALARSIDLVLVDEFQDTDPVQSEILDALSGPGQLDGKLFLVGDFKQSIYRFRGARPELFRDYRDRFAESGRLALSENFRSVPAILDFVNALFAETFDEPDVALRPGGTQLEVEGSTSVEFLWGQPTDDPASNKLDANARRKEEARRLAGYLKVRLDRGWMIRDRKSLTLRKATQGDVALLFRSLSDSSEYEQALVAEGLDFHVVGGSGFYAQQEVLDLINVLTAVDNPLDAVALAGALRSPFFSISDDALYWLATDRKGFPHVGLDRSGSDGAMLERLPESDRPRAERARRLLDRWRSIKDRSTISDLIDQILAESGYEAALIGEFLGDRKRANARKLVRMARRFDEPGGFTLADFVARLRADLRGATKETQAATTDEEGEIIRLMSVHQAKGLEFPIVFLPDLDRKRPGERSRVAFDPELGPLLNPVAEVSEGLDGEEEESGHSLGWTIHRHRERQADDAEALRLFYVATTRARDALVLSSATDPSKKPNSPAMTLLDRRFDRATGQFRGDLPPGWGAPRVQVVDAPQTPAGSGDSTHRQRPRLLEVARTIREGSGKTNPISGPRAPRPRFVILDPTSGFSTTSTRLDRLIREILADPRSLGPGNLKGVAANAARLQDPVSPAWMVAEAIGQVETWSRSAIAREIARSSEVRRAFPWKIHWPVEGHPILFQGRGDFLYRRADGSLGVILIGGPGASIPLERLRLAFSNRAAEELAGGVVSLSRWVRLGEGGTATETVEVEPASVDQAVHDFLELTISGP